MNKCLLRRTHTTKPAKRFLHHFAVSLEMNKLTREGRAVRMCVCVCVYTNIPNRQMFKGISCGKIRLVTRVGVAVCSVRGLHIHLFCLSQMQMYVKKYYGATFLHKSSAFVVVNDNTARFSYERELLAGKGRVCGAKDMETRTSRLGGFPGWDEKLIFQKI